MRYRCQVAHPVPSAHPRHRYQLGILHHLSRAPRYTILSTTYCDQSHLCLIIHDRLDAGDPMWSLRVEKRVSWELLISQEGLLRNTGH